MNRILFSPLTALVSAGILLSCAQEKLAVKPQEGSSMVFNGIAVITEIRDVRNPGVIDENSYVEIYFDFVPLKNGKPAYSEIESTGRMIKLVYDNRDTFHKNWLKKWDIKTGNEYPALYRKTKKENKLNYVTYEIFIEPAKK